MFHGDYLIIQSLDGLQDLFENLSKVVIFVVWLINIYMYIFKIEGKSVEDF